MKKIILPIFIVAVLIVVIVKYGNPFKVFFGTKTEVGTVVVSNIKSIKQLKVVTIYREVVMKLNKQEPGKFYGVNDCIIAGKFPGTINVGFDLDECSADWITISNEKNIEEKTVSVKLPPVKILNMDDWFLDDAQKVIPIENGTWSNTERGALAVLANAKLKRAALLDDCYELAEKRGVEVIRNMIASYGFSEDKINVEIEPRIDYETPAAPNKQYIAQNGKPRYEIWEYPSDYQRIVYPNGNAVFFNGLSYSEILDLADMMFYNSSYTYSVYKTGNTVSFSIRNPNIVKYTPQANDYVKIHQNDDMSDWKNFVKYIFHGTCDCILSEYDANGNTFITYN